MPRYQQLAEALAAEIGAGRIGVGDLLPPETELARQFDVSRHTVREALRVLRNQGLIASRQGMGSRVRSASPRVGYVEALTSIDDLLEFALASHLEQVKVEDVVADDERAEQLGGQPGRRWVRITGLRAANDANSTPICWADLYLDPALSSVRDLDRLSQQVALFRRVEAELRGDVEVHQEIAVASIPVEWAESLGCEPGAEALRVVRTYLDRDGRPFMVAINLHPADRYTHRTVLRPRAVVEREVRT
jgi:DNA-binding GntR family transcriptional regulator